MKYNDNGTYKDIYVKAFDTLPVGAIVEYSGSTIPSGWTNIGNDKIQKTSQYMQGGASLSNVYGTSNENGYTQEYINKQNEYSTDEIRVGTWLGKPLYRKVIQTTIPTSGNNQNVSFQNNVAIMKSVTGFALQSASGGVNLILPYISMTNSWSIYAYYNRANQELIIENSGASFMNNTTCYLIAEYTKTTD